MAHYIRGNLAMQWLGATKQLDTVINYEYDEDFNPIEVRETVSRPVPQILGTVSSDAKQLSGYLTAQGVLDTVAGQVNPDVFPLFSLFVRAATDSQLDFTTVPDAEKRVSITSIRGVEYDALYFYLDLVAVARQSVLPAHIGVYLAPFSTIEIQGFSGSDGDLAIGGKTTMPNASVNSLIQLVDWSNRRLHDE